MQFEKNVFVNCPFDKEYLILLRPLLFTVLYLGYEPRISQTVSSANIRVDQIKQHIRRSKFGIHDLSRCRTLGENELPRFNMSFELGLDIGCLEFGGKKYQDKKILILESEKYHYQKVLSDIAGQDICNHDNFPKTLVQKVRNWFSTIDELHVYPSFHEIWKEYILFFENFKVKFKDLTPEEMDEIPVADFIKLAKRWINITSHNIPEPIPPHKPQPRPAPLLHT